MLAFDFIIVPTDWHFMLVFDFITDLTLNRRPSIIHFRGNRRDNQDEFEDTKGVIRISNIQYRDTGYIRYMAHNEDK